MMMSETVKRNRVSALWRVELPNDLDVAWGIAVAALLGVIAWTLIIAVSVAVMN